MINNLVFVILITLIGCSKINVSDTKVSGLETPFENQVPVANDDSFTINHNIALPITLSATDADGHTLTYSILTPPTNGTILGSGASITYVPSSTYLGADSFTYTVNDGFDDSNIATVNITVQGFSETLFLGGGHSANAVALARDNSAFVVGGTEIVSGFRHWIVKHYSGPDFSTVRVLENTESPVPSAIEADVYAVDISSDGKTVVAAGRVLVSGNYHWLVKRYSGTDFATVETIDYISGTDTSNSFGVAMSNDGTFIVAAGMVDNSGYNRWLVKKYSGTGFSTVTTLESSSAPVPSGVNASASSIDITLDDSSIVVGGWASTDGINNNWVVKRYRGSNFSTVDIIDNSKGAVGVDAALVTSVSISDDGKTIAASGASYTSWIGKWLVKKYEDPEADNTYTPSILDHSFGSTGGVNAEASSVSVSSDATKISAGGMMFNNSEYKWLVKSYTGSAHSTETVLQNLGGAGGYSKSNSVALSNDGLWFLSAGILGNGVDNQWHVISDFMP